MISYYDIFRYNYDLQGRMIATTFKTKLSNDIVRQLETSYTYKSSISQFPEKCTLPSGSEFKFLRDDHNEELFGIVTPKQHKHLFQLIPLMGKTLFQYRPPWITSIEKAYYFIFNDVTSKLKDETVIFPNGDSIVTNDEGATACFNKIELSSLNKCRTIQFNNTDKVSEISSTYEIGHFGQVFV